MLRNVKMRFSSAAAAAAPDICFHYCVDLKDLLNLLLLTIP